MLDYLFIVAVLCYVSMQFIETVSFGSRVAGKLTNRLALGTTLQHSVFTASRLFLPPLLLSLSLMIESDLSIQSFLITSIVLTILAFFSSLVVLVRFNYFQLLFQRLFALYQTNTVPIAIVKLLRGKVVEFEPVDLRLRPSVKDLSLKKIITSGFAYFFLSTGFLIAFSLAILIPEYRMTMSQLTAAFHGIGAIVLSMYIDPMVSRSLDVELENRHWIDNVYAIFLGRILAYLFASLIFLALYLYALLT